MNTKIDISSLDAETKNKLDHYVELAQKLVEGTPVEITIRLKEPPVFQWEEGNTGFLTPNNFDESVTRYIDWDDLAKQEKAIENKYNLLIKEICDFSDSVADSLNVDRKEFFDSFFLYL